MCDQVTEFSEKTTMSMSPSVLQGWFRGVMRAVPIVLGYVPVGLAYGILAQKAGISPLNTILMSILVYAGSSQLIAVSLFGAHVPVLSIIMTTFVVNLRHLIMTSALTPYLKHWRTWELAAFAYEVTDETFAVHSTQFPESVPGKAEVFAINLTAQTAWITGTILGIVLGQLVTNVKPFALDYALPAMFVALLVLQIRHWRHVVVALMTGTLALFLHQLGMTQWHVMTAAVIGATIGVILESWIKT